MNKSSYTELSVELLNIRRDDVIATSDIVLPEYPLGPRTNGTY